MADNRCQDTFFDWTVNLNHWDSRVVRNCYPNSYRETDQNGNGVFREKAAWSGATILGVKKAAACIYYINRESYKDSNGDLDCKQFDGTTANVNDNHSFAADDTMADKFVQIWVRRPNGNRDFISGGVPSDGNN